MLKISYQFTAMSPLFTGDDETLGTVNMFRRRTYNLPVPIHIRSRFKNSAERSVAAMNVIYPVYSNVDAKLKSDYYGYYEQFSNNVRAASTMPNKKAFLNRLLQLCSISVLQDGSAQLVREALDKFSDEEFIFTLRNEHQYLMILLREYVQFYRSDQTNVISGLSIERKLFGAALDTSENIDYTKSTEQIPCISGNSIRGIIRRIVMSDFAHRTGIKSFRKEIYHQLFTGGNLTSSSGQEDIEFREKYVSMCPMLGLLGSAIGNQMLQSAMNVFSADICCSELGTGEASFWELLEIDFGTRLDSSKTEKEIEITGEMKETTQMLYQIEKIIPGTQFSGKMILDSDDELTQSAFWHALKLFKENGIIGGMSARGNGLVNIEIDIPVDGDKYYCDYLEKHKSEIQSFFSELNEEKKKK